MSISDNEHRYVQTHISKGDRDRQRQTEPDRDRQRQTEIERQERQRDRKTEIQRETQLDIKRQRLQERKIIWELKWEKWKKRLIFRVGKKKTARNRYVVRL